MSFLTASGAFCAASAAAAASTLLSLCPYFRLFVYLLAAAVWESALKSLSPTLFPAQKQISNDLCAPTWCFERTTR